MSSKHTYVLGLNAYDHDVSACLLRDGEIAFAINKERITRKKHDTGFYQKVVDYCLAAEGISLDDVDLVVRNCYVLPVEDLELRLLSQYVPEVMDDEEREQAKTNPLYLSKSNKVVTVSHHLAHAYSAFAACPFDEGAVMVVDGVGNYSSDITEPGQLTDNVNPLARESESYYKFEGSRIETLKKIWLKPVRGFLSDEFYVARDQERRGGCSRVGRGVRQAVLARARARLGSKSIDAALERRCLARSRRRGDLAPQARHLAARSNWRQEPVHGGRCCAQLRRQRANRAGGRLRQRVDSAGGGRRWHCDRLRLLRLSGDPEKTTLIGHAARLSRRSLYGRRCARGCPQIPRSSANHDRVQQEYLP